MNLFPVQTHTRPLSTSGGIQVQLRQTSQTMSASVPTCQQLPSHSDTNSKSAALIRHCPSPHLLLQCLASWTLLRHSGYHLKAFALAVPHQMLFPQLWAGPSSFPLLGPTQVSLPDHAPFLFHILSSALLALGTLRAPVLYLV